MAKFGFIPDGCTLPFFIEETEFHPAVKGTFRRMLNSERASALRRIQESNEKRAPDGTSDKGAAEGEKILMDETAKRIASWDLSDPNGNLVEIKIENFNRIESHLVARLWQVITGFDVPGEDPAEKELEREKN